MNSELIKAFTIGALSLGAATPARAQPPVDIGKREYLAYCAFCHGAGAKGDGPLTPLLKKPATDLTRLQTSNMGVFPFDRIYRVIDGRETFQAHGTREMPAWGFAYSAEAQEFMFGFATPRDLESHVRDRIIALIGYIHSLQEQ